LGIDVVCASTNYTARKCKIKRKKGVLTEVERWHYHYILGKPGLEASNKGQAADRYPKHVIPLSCILVICYLIGTAIENVRY
jgi:hypothetical protein